mmetsp:Transcript_60933/g.149199  ORF Transcript_60933/g.149199 Transcript_60933/m.149199 type:complete len:83 (-) Transcript_60933:195-443(-)
MYQYIFTSTEALSTFLTFQDENVTELNKHLELLAGRLVGDPSGTHLVVGWVAGNPSYLWLIVVEDRVWYGGRATATTVAFVK